MVMVSVASGVLGYVLIGALKSKVNPILLLPAAAVFLIVLFANLPKQIRRVEEDE